MRSIMFVAGMSHRMASVEGVRAVLDAVCRRIGPTAWHARLSDEMLASVRQCLLAVLPSRKSFVAAYEVSGFANKRIRLLWTVGNGSVISADGEWVAARKSRPWRGRTKVSVGVAQQIAEMAYFGGLAHDLGKNTIHFQSKLGSGVRQPDAKRHEVVSVERLSGSDCSTWRAPAVALATSDSLGDMGDDKLLGWVEYLALTHHRLPHLCNRTQRISLEATGHIRCDDQGMDEQPLVEQLVPETQAQQVQLALSVPIASAAAFVYSRLALILADHYVSSLGIGGQQRGALAHVIARLVKPPVAADDVPMANGNQALAGHIQAVARLSRTIAPRLLSGAWMAGMGFVDGSRLAAIAATDGPFRWQAKAVEAVSQYVKSLPDGVGGLVLVAASTGSGKTRACAAMAGQMCGDRARLTVALGLRTLTLQTYRYYKAEIGMEDDVVDLVIGSAAYKGIHLRDEGSDHEIETAEEQLVMAASRCAGAIDLLPPIAAQCKSPGDKRYLQVPVAVCTIDQIMKAADHRRSSWTKPWLRLMSSKALIIDEIDGFGLSDSAAVLRLIYFAAMMGAHVIVASATVYPALAKYIIMAWEQGARQRLKIVSADDSFNPSLQAALIGDNPETNTLIAANASPEAFASTFDAFARGLASAALYKKRTAKIIGAGVTNKEAMRHEIVRACCELHQKNSLEVQVGNRITGLSIGMIKLLHVKEVVAMARHLAEHVAKLPSDAPMIRAIVYHGRNTMLARAYIEQFLDDVLRRKGGRTPLANEIVRKLVDDAAREGRQACLIVITTLEEVGQDHDYDWAVIEPASARSIVQSAGRVRRHREVSEQQENIAILDRNFVDLGRLSKGGKSTAPCFNRPGFERESCPYRSHTISSLIGHDAEITIDAGMCMLPQNDSLGYYDNQSIDQWLEQAFEKKWIGNPYAPITSNHYETYVFRKNTFKECEYVVDYVNNILMTDDHEMFIDQVQVDLLGQLSIFRCSWADMAQSIGVSADRISREMLTLKVPAQHKMSVRFDPMYGAVYYPDPNTA